MFYDVIETSEDYASPINSEVEEFTAKNNSNNNVENSNQEDLQEGDGHFNDKIQVLKQW